MQQPLSMVLYLDNGLIKGYVANEKRLQALEKTVKLFKPIEIIIDLILNQLHLNHMLKKQYLVLNLFMMKR